MSQYLEVYNANHDFLRAAHSYPVGSFPGHSHEPQLQDIMRKKLTPQTEDWVADHAKLRIADGPQVDSTQTNGSLAAIHVRSDELKTDDLTDLWEWAGPTSNAVVKDMMESGAFEDDYTLAERGTGIENVVTGLNRKLGDESSDDEDDEDDAMDEDNAPKRSAKPIVEESQPPMQLERMLRFMSTGIMPP